MHGRAGPSPSRASTSKILPPASRRLLINADRYVKSKTDDYHDLPVAKQNFQRRERPFSGVELVPDVQRLALMNAMLHDIEGDIVLLGDTLGPTGARLPLADVILTNPPFGTKRAAAVRRATTSPRPANKQLVFLQHIYRGSRRSRCRRPARQRAV